MQCTVLVFAQLAETLGTDRVSLELAAGSTVAAALDTLTATHVSMVQLLPVLAVVVNDDFCNSSIMLEDGNTLGLIPSCSGGEKEDPRKKTPAAIFLRGFFVYLRNSSDTAWIRSSVATNASTTAGSKWLPEPSTMIFRASAWDIAFL